MLEHIMHAAGRKHQQSSTFQKIDSQRKEKKVGYIRIYYSCIWAMEVDISLVKRNKIMAKDISSLL